MNKIRGLLVLNLNSAMYSRAAADDAMNTLLLNGYTVTMEQHNEKLYVEYSKWVEAEDSEMFPLIRGGE